MKGTIPKEKKELSKVEKIGVDSIMRTMGFSWCRVTFTPGKPDKGMWGKDGLLIDPDGVIPE